jgi:ABC-type transporter Mla subunit MlaD
MQEIVRRRILSTIFIILSLIALGFLVYTLINIDSLEMTSTHPRVIVEFSLFLSFIVIGVLLRHRK